MNILTATPVPVPVPVPVPQHIYESTCMTKNDHMWPNRIFTLIFFTFSVAYDL